MRRELRERSALGEYGAAAIRIGLTRSHAVLPCERTIHRILARHGLVTRRRTRYPAPPPGWYLPKLSSREYELDAFDFVEGFALARGRHFDAFTGISLWGNLAMCAILGHGATLPTSLHAIEQHWLEHGCPYYAQLDNDSIFQGSHGHVGCLGRFVHGCLCLGVTPVFTPPRETGFQAKIEAFNRRWQDAVWRRFHFRSYPQLQCATDRFIAAHRQAHAVALERGMRQPAHPLCEAREPQRARVIFLRRADAHGHLELLRQQFQLPPAWQHRLVRCEIDLHRQHVSCFGLRRRQPDHQPLLLNSPIRATLTPWHSPSR
jgi:hypothetical protein